MPSTSYSYKKSIIQRSMCINAVFIAIGFLGLALDDLSNPYLTALFCVCMAYFSYKLIRDYLKLSSPVPAVTISDEGIRDTYLGRAVIPWGAIIDINATPPIKTIGGQLFLIADASQFKTTPGPFVIRLANWLRGGKKGNGKQRLALPMTPLAALDATLDDMMKDINSHNKATVTMLPESPYPGQ